MAPAFRPLPHRGDLVAAGAVPLVLAVVLINIRMDPVWGTGVLLLLDLVVGAGLLGLGLAADPEPQDTDRGGGGPGRPRPYVAVLLLSGLLASFLGVVRLSQVLGADGVLASAGQSFWTTAVLVLGALALWRARDVAVMVFVAAIAGVLSVYSFIAWVFNPSGVQTIRWVAFVLILAYIGVHLVLRGSRRREAVLFVDAAGVLAFFLAYTLALDLIQAIPGLTSEQGPHGVPGGWALVSLASGLGLVAFAALEREPGPAFLGVAVLAVFVAVTSVQVGTGPSLIFWPLFLLALGAAGLIVGLRPARPLPPPPDADSGPGETVDLPPRR